MTLILDLHGGETLCAAFRGAAGGTEVKDDNRLWKLKNAAADGCVAVSRLSPLRCGRAG